MNIVWVRARKLEQLYIEKIKLEKILNSRNDIRVTLWGDEATETVTFLSQTTIKDKIKKRISKICQEIEYVQRFLTPKQAEKVKNLIAPFVQ